jgi:hypothetical protein
MIHIKNFQSVDQLLIVSRRHSRLCLVRAGVLSYFYRDAVKSTQDALL